MASASKTKNLYAAASSNYYILGSSFVENEMTETNIANNTSTITVTASLTCHNVRFDDGRSGNTLAIYWVDDNENTTRKFVNSKDILRFATTSSSDSVSGTITVKHKSDGTLNGYAVATWTKGRNNDWIPNSGEVSTNNTSLTNIARKSVLNSVQIEVYNNGNISITPYLTKYDYNFYDCLTMYSGDKSITINGVENNSPIALTAGQKAILYEIMGTATSTTLSCYLTTFTSYGGTNLGNSNVIPAIANLPNYNLNINASCSDSISTYDNYKNSTTDIIANLSKPTISFSASSSTGALYGRNINYTLNGNLAVSPTTITDYRGGNFVIEASDGRKNVSWNSTNVIIPYEKPTINCSITRPNPTGNTAAVNITGTYYDGEGLKNSALSSMLLELSYKETEGNMTTISNFQVTTSINNHIVTFTAMATLTGLNYQKGIEFTASITDLVGIISTISDKVPRGLPVWNAFIDNNDTNHYNVNGIFTINNENILNLVYPVGAIYLSTNSTSPATLFGGTWSRIKDVFLLTAGNTYTAGGTGGAASVTLTAAQSGLRWHDHGLNGHTHSFNADFYIRHGSSSGTETLASGTNTTVTKNAYSSSWGNGFSVASYSHNPDKLAISGTTGGSWASTAGSGSWDASESHNNMPPYLTVYAWERTQ